MSSPTKLSGSPAGGREGTRVILREITASLHNSPPMDSPNKSGNETLSKTRPEHEIKVRFAREFADVESHPVTCPGTESSNSISSASSFQSLTSTLSTKSSSGICADSPTRSTDTSYANLDVSGSDDCAGIRLGATIEAEQSLADATFALAADSSHRLPNISTSTSPEPLSVDEILSKTLPDHEIKVRSAKTFADVVSHTITRPDTESSNNISSASNFQSLTSTLSTKSSSGIRADSPTRSTDTSYANPDVSGLDDLIAACAGIRLDATIEAEQSLADATFASAADSSLFDQTHSRSRSITPNPDVNATQTLETNLNATNVISDRLSPVLNCTQDLNVSSKSDYACQNVTINVPVTQTISPEYTTANETFLQSISPHNNGQEDKNHQLKSESAVPASLESVLEQTETSIATAAVSTSQSPVAHDPEESASDLLKAEGKFKEPLPVDSKNSTARQSVSSIAVPNIDSSRSEQVIEAVPDVSTDVCISDIKAPTFLDNHSLIEKTTTLVTEPTAQTIVSEQGEAITEVPEKESNRESDELSVERPIEHETSTDTYSQLTTTTTTTTNTSIIKKTEADLTESGPPIINKEKEFTTEGTLDSTVLIEDIDTDNSNNFSAPEVEQREATFEPVKQSTSIVTSPVNLNSPTSNDYIEFVPQRQSTTLNPVAPQQNLEINKPEIVTESTERKPEVTEPVYFDACGEFSADSQVDYENLKLAAESVAQDIYNTSLELIEEQGFTTAPSGLFRDSTNFDFLISKSGQRDDTSRLRESLYLKFDPLVANTSMLPQGNGATSPSSDERNGEKDASMPNIVTPKRNPAIAAIDRLLFYSPMSPGIQKHEESVKIEPTEKTPEPVPVVDLAMAKELELVRSTVLQLEEQLEKQRRQELEKQKEHEAERETLLEKINQLQKDLAQEVKSKNQINVVVDEYEKSISRLVAERERDRKNIDVEKASLLEELQDVKNHLAASEAAFNDVHAKYERLKVVVATSKNNEDALKGSIAENVEIIKSLETRYEQLKTHAAARLEKANYELEGIRKQHESETVKLRAMLRKEELKSNSLTEMIEQKTKENTELTKILDEVIARVDTGVDQ